MSTLRLAQPEPTAEGLLAHARRIAVIARRATDPVTGDFLIAKAEDQYAIAIKALVSTSKASEASEARDELKRFSVESRFQLHDAPVLAGNSPFRRALDALAATEAIGSYYNGTDDVDEIVALAKRRIAQRDRLGAAEDAVRAATCLLWRAQREEETVALYNEFTDALVRDVKGHVDNGLFNLVEKKADIARKRLLLTGRRAEAWEIDRILSEASRPMGAASS